MGVKYQEQTSFANATSGIGGTEIDSNSSFRLTIQRWYWENAHMNRGTCPQCKNVINNVETEYVEIGIPPTKTWKGISYLCPSGKTVLSVAIDPVSLREETVERVVRHMGQLRKES